MKKELLQRLNENSKLQHFVWMNRINVYNAKELPADVDINNVLGSIESKVPSLLLSNIESIYIGDFDTLRERDLDALYEDGAIYIRAESVFSEEDLVDDLIHEVSHSLEETNSLEIYGDGEIEKEFLFKRIQLLTQLSSYDAPVLPRDYFLNTSYSKEFDEYLYKEVGYPLLTSLSMNIFASPYGATSLSEYFANAFEKYFVGESEEVRKLSPQVYEKIKYLTELGEDIKYGNLQY